MSGYIYFRDELGHIIQSMLQKYHVDRAVLFDSYARNEATALSDFIFSIEVAALRFNTALSGTTVWLLFHFHHLRGILSLN